MRSVIVVGLVRRLLTLEAAESQAQDTVIEAAERVCGKLHLQLSRTIGQEASQTLLARALTSAMVQFPHLSAVRIEADGSVIGLQGAAGAGTQKSPRTLTQQDAVEGVVTLVVHLLELLFVFIGEDLALRLLRTVSPGLALPEMSDEGAKKETNQ